MTIRNRRLISLAVSMAVSSSAAIAASDTDVKASDADIQAQRSALAESTGGAGFGPQSPRDIGSAVGSNSRLFETAPSYTEMNLCNIHFHESAEHKGGEFTKSAGNGDGKGHGTGFEYSGELSASETAALDEPMGDGSLQPGDTIEVHYVHSTAQVVPGPTLGACLSESIANPQLRVETQVYVLVNDDSALDFTQLTEHGEMNGLQQALNIPTDTGEPIQYAGSTTGPRYNEKGSPLQVSWSVRPSVAKVNIKTIGAWFENNVFDEDHAHAVRNLVVNPELLSNIDG